MPIREEKGYTPIQLIEHINGGIPCEICGKAVPVADTHSMVVSYAMPGSGYAAFQCANDQHYGCCRDHAILAAFTCVFDHMLNKPHAGQDDNLIDDLEKIYGIVAKHATPKRKE